MPDESKPYLYEFLFRGRPDGGDFHVILAQDVEDAFGIVITSTSAAMTPAQAKAMGFDVPAIVAGIDTVTAEENAALKARVEGLQAEIGRMPAPAGEPSV